MKLTLRTLSGGTTVFEVTDEETVGSLKAKLADDYDLSSLKLCHKGKVLDDAKTFKDLGFGDAETLIIAGKKKALVVKAPAPETAPAPAPAPVQARPAATSSTPTETPLPSTPAPTTQYFATGAKRNPPSSAPNKNWANPRDDVGDSPKVPTGNNQKHEYELSMMKFPDSTVEDDAPMSTLLTGNNPFLAPLEVGIGDEHGVPPPKSLTDGELAETVTTGGVGGKSFGVGRKRQRPITRSCHHPNAFVLGESGIFSGPEPGFRMFEEPWTLRLCDLPASVFKELECRYISHKIPGNRGKGSGTPSPTAASDVEPDYNAVVKVPLYQECLSMPDSGARISVTIPEDVAGQDLAFKILLCLLYWMEFEMPLNYGYQHYTTLCDPMFVSNVHRTCEPWVQKYDRHWMIFTFNQRVAISKTADQELQIWPSIPESIMADRWSLLVFQEQDSTETELRRKKINRDADDEMITRLKMDDKSVRGDDLGNNHERKSLDEFSLAIRRKTTVLGKKTDHLEEDPSLKLHQAAASGNCSEVSRILVGGVSTEVVNALGETPLLLAVKNGHCDVVKVLLSYYASTNPVVDATMAEWTPLHEAAKLPTLQIAEELLAAGADTDARSRGLTWLHVAMESHRGFLPTTATLLEAGVCVDAVDWLGKTALHHALRQPRLRLWDTVISTLLCAGANPLVQDNFGNTPLHVAAEEGHVNATQLLLEAGAHRGFDVKNSKGRTAVLTALKYGHRSVAEVLRARAGQSTPSFKILRDEERLGRGGFGVVYRARDLLTDREVAVKIAKPTEVARSGLVKESKILQSLEHKNIIKHVFYQFDEQRQEHQLFMEKLDDQTVAKRIAMYGPMGENRIRRYLSGTLQGLAYLHGQGVLHRDIKPENMLIDIDAQVKLADFGLSSVLLEGCDSISADYVMGTAPYMAPEILKARHYCEGSDLWALACSVVKMATGKRPWAGVEKHGHDLLKHIKKSESHPAIPDHLSTELQDLLCTMFHQDPKLRGTASAALLAPYFQIDLPEDAPPELVATPTGVRAGGNVVSDPTTVTTTTIVQTSNKTTSASVESCEASPEMKPKF